METMKTTQRDIRTEAIGYLKMIQMRADDAIDHVYGGQLREAVIALGNIRNFLEAADRSLIDLGIKLV